MDAHWDLDALSHLFLPVDTHIFRTIPVGFASGEERLVWHFDAEGEYKVKSGYRLAMENNIQPLCKWWINTLWGLLIPPKIKMFMWRVFQEILPTSSNLCRRVMGCSNNV